MKKKPKFNPEITRVKLNPEQAVLACTCYDNSRRYVSGSERGGPKVCIADTRDPRTPDCAGTYELSAPSS